MSQENRPDLAERVKEEARRLGFDLLGITTPDAPPHLDIYRQWLSAGRHGEMGYLATERGIQRRADPRRILPDCASILVAAINYFPGQREFGAGNARVAAYALGEDYHDFLLERLKRMVKFIGAQVGYQVPYRVYTDTGPLLERELAQRAGLGWIGKNTCLINPQRGSYFLLGEALLGVELAADSPFTNDHCGKCIRCIQACPAGCILPDRTLDSRRCISYLTIELKGAIPAPLRPTIGNWVFGCDLCQQVCPWNRRFARPTRERAFRPRPLQRNPGISDFLELTPGDFRKHFANTPLRRAKYGGFLRNLVVAAGNSRSEQFVARLSDLMLRNPEAMVRRHAAWALGQIGGQQAQRALARALASERDETALEEVRSAISRASTVSPGTSKPIPMDH